MRKGQSRKFRQQFAKFTCEGDTIRAELPGGFTAVARIERDHCGDTPEERQDGFWPSLDPKDNGYIGDKSKRSLQRETARMKEVMRSWENDEWFYCGVCVTIEKNDIELTGRYDHALWGIECNWPGPSRFRRNSYLRDVANELLPEALEAAQNKIEALAA